MASGKLKLQCDTTVRDILCTAIREYAMAAYPPGGSDCAQVSHAALMDLAAEIESGITPENACILISRRPRAMVKAAITYHYDRLDAEQGGVTTQQRELLVSVLQENPVMAADLQSAAAVDAT